ncbi:ATP-binding protein [Paenibacillus woosongensis]|uniref:ATP-binding protein n=1 Tax=Paenibacillus woosongensis TaxID=307580 RepID=A0AA95IAT7_9BACL|nr:ATP-binding protein [Paenibacillus woosongensis]WHX48543.1 ATP-binding protein [Paenibacillus woosongensis]
MVTALGVEACRQGQSVQFYRVSDLVAVLQEKFAASILTRFREKLSKLDLLILDELCYVPFSQTGAPNKRLPQNKLSGQRTGHDIY